MEQLRPVSKTEKIVFPIVAMIIVIGLLPYSSPTYRNANASVTY